MTPQKRNETRNIMKNPTHIAPRSIKRLASDKCFFNLRPGISCWYFSSYLLAGPNLLRKDAKAVESYSHNSFISFNSRLRLSCRNRRAIAVVVLSVLCKSLRAQHKHLIFIRQLYLFTFTWRERAICARLFSSLHLLSAYSFFFCRQKTSSFVSVSSGWQFDINFHFMSRFLF